MYRGLETVQLSLICTPVQLMFNLHSCRSFSANQRPGSDNNDINTLKALSTDGNDFNHKNLFNWE